MQSETLYSTARFQKQRPAQYVFGLVAFLLLLAGMIGLLFPEFTLNMTMHDTYIDVMNAHVAFALSLICIAFGGIYTFFHRLGKPLHLRMGIAHCLLTVAPIVGAWILMLFWRSNVPVRYYSTAAIKDLYAEQYSFSNLVIIVPAFLFILGQIIFLMNLCLTLMPHRQEE